MNSTVTCLSLLQSLLMVVVVLVTIASPVSSFPNNVNKMEISDINQIRHDTQPITSNVRSRLESLFNHHGIKFQLIKHISVPKLRNSFRWNKCDNRPSLMDLTELSITPDPLHFPGNLYVQFSGIIKETIDAPLQANLTLEKIITPAFKLKIPCIDGVGSCDYDDLCETLQSGTCPNPFVKYNIPCKCPFKKGSYKMQKSGFNINVQDVPGGNYYLKSSVSYSNKLVSCVEIYFAIQRE